MIDRGHYFEATAEHVNQLTDNECVDLFYQMLKADAEEIGIPVTSVYTGLDSVPDGGVDASVDLEPPSGGHLIVGSYPSYQIKAGKSFKPWNNAEIEKELFGKREHGVKRLGRQTERCFANRRTYILVCMKVKLNAQQRDDAIESLRQAVRTYGLPDPDVRVWGQDQVLAALNMFPYLAIRVNNRSTSGVMSHDIWNAKYERKPIVKEREQEDFVKKLCMELKDDNPVHVNVCGEVGIGKTLLLLETTRDPSLSQFVVYCTSVKSFSDHLLPALRQTNSMRVIPVIDNCDPYQIWDEVKNMNPRIRLVTISNECKKMPDMRWLEVPRLSDNGIQNILLGYVDDSVLAYCLSLQCGGIPKIAHDVGLDAQQNPDDMFGSGFLSHAFERYIRLGDEPGSSRAQQRERVLLVLSLFKKFGYGRDFQKEADFVFNLVHTLDGSIHRADFNEAIRALIERKIVYGDGVMCLSHKMLRTWLWVRFWETHGHDFDVVGVARNLPGPLRGWFLDMFEYVSHSNEAKVAVKRTFEESGALHSPDELKTVIGSKLFHAASRADPGFALLHLEEVMCRWTQEDLQNFTTGRQSVIDGLERIMFEPSLFEKGGRLLRRFAEAESETGHYNATEAFCNMFSLDPGYMSNTKSPPSYRMPLLRETLCDQDEKRRDLGLKACRAALQVNYSSMSNQAHGDLDLDIKGWVPSTVRQYQEPYLNVIELLHEKTATFPPNERRAGAQIIFDCSRSLLRTFPGIADRVIEELSDIRDDIGDENMLREILGVIEFDSGGLDSDAISKLERLRDDIVGSSYSDLMNRYVKMDPRVDPIGQEYEESKRAKIQDLARKSLDATILGPHLDWLVTNDAKCGNLFGYELSLLDDKEALLPEILEAQRNSGENGSGFFLGGYMAGIFKTDRDKWNRAMTNISEDSRLIRFFVEISRSGITDEIGMLLLDLVRQGMLPARRLSTLSFGLANRPSPEVAGQWLKTMIESRQPEAVAGALRMYYSFFVRKRKEIVDADLALSILTHDTILGNASASPNCPAIDWIYWKEIALMLIEQDPEKSIQLARRILESVDGIKTMLYRDQMMNVLDQISIGSPNETWDVVAQYINPPLDKRGRAISKWLRGGMLGLGGSFLARVESKKIFAWIDHDTPKRAPLMARYVPPQLQSDNCLVKELLKRYGQDDSVQEALLANFLTGNVSYSELQDNKKARDVALVCMESEGDANVNRWLGTYVARLDKLIENV